MARTTTGIAVARIGGLAGVAPGAGAEIRRHPALLQQLQPAERLHHRGGDDRDRHGVLGRLQQSPHLRPEQADERLRHHPARAGRELGMGCHASTRLTVKLRQGVKWHDGKPFTAKDVQCTWNKIQGKDPDEFRKNPARAWWSNLKEVTIDGDFEATFVLARPQASFPTLLASNLSPVYPCHVPTKDMRTKPIGTGPFKFVAVRCQHVGQARQEHRVLEAGAALSRRRRVQHHRQPLDPHPRLRRQRVRTDIRCRYHRAADGRGHGALAQGHMPAGADRRQHQPDRQSQQAALRQRAAAQGHDAGARPAGDDRHRQRRQIQHRRRHDAVSRRAAGGCPRRC